MLRLPAWSEWMTSLQALQVSQARGRRTTLAERQAGQCEDEPLSPQRAEAMASVCKAWAMNVSVRSKAQKP